MRFQSLFTVGLLAAGVIGRSLPSAAEGLEERNLVARDDECGDDGNGISKREPCKQPVQCGPEEDRQAYTSLYVNAAVKAAKPLISKNEKKGTSPYPRSGFGANEPSILKALPDECRASVGNKQGLKLWEYPIVVGGLYDGGDPGPDRVIISDYNGARLYCVTVTHRGNEENIHSLCPATTA
ncbi:MAG: hypothetical protein Q9168_006990 [Polycauliona sp. 1 TL-2023]